MGKTKQVTKHPKVVYKTRSVHEDPTPILFSSKNGLPILNGFYMTADVKKRVQADFNKRPLENTPVQMILFHQQPSNNVNHLLTFNNNYLSDTIQSYIDLVKEEE